MRRLLTGVTARLAALAAVTLAVGAMPLYLGRDPALAVLRARSSEREADAEALASVRHELGFDDGPLALLLRWAGGAVRGDLGTSWVSGEPVSGQIAGAFAVSATLTGLALLVAVLVMILLTGRPLLLALRGRTIPTGRAAAVVAALPEFLTGSVLLLVFAAHLHWFPASGWDDLGHAILPAIALGTTSGAILSAIATDAIRDAASEPWLRTWAASGFRQRTVARGILKRAAPVVIGQLGLVAAGLFGSAAVVEVLFAVPGIGRLAVDAALAQDVPVVQACVLMILLVGTAAGLAGSLARRVLLGPAYAAGALLSAPPRLVRGGAPYLVLAVAAAIIGWGLTRDPLAVDLSSRLLPPSFRSPMGTDALGRDVLARLAHGAANTALLALAVTAAMIVLGLLGGLVARRGAVLADLTNALPPVVIALAIAAAAGPGRWSAAAAISAVAWAPLASHARSLAAEQLRSQHLKASRALGASRWHLLIRHVLPAVTPPVLRNAFVRLPAVALALTSLGYLGLGAQPPAPDWGQMIAEGMPYVERAPWVVAYPMAGLIALGLAAVAAAGRMR